MEISQIMKLYEEKNVRKDQKKKKDPNPTQARINHGRSSSSQTGSPASRLPPKPHHQSRSGAPPSLVQRRHELTVERGGGESNPQHHLQPAER